MANGSGWTQIEDEICLTQLGRFRQLMEFALSVDKNTFKQFFAENILNKRNEFSSRNVGDILEHFEFLDRLTRGSIEIENVPAKYKSWHGINDNL